MLTPLDYLARAHHKKQVEEAFVASRSVQRFFSGVDLHDRRAVGAAIDRAAPTLLQRRAASVSRAGGYYRHARLLAGHEAWSLDEVQPDDDNIEDRLRNSLWVTARGRLSERERKQGYPRAEAVAIGELQRAAVRHTLDGGRSATINMVKRDGVAIGFVRLTSMDNRVCAFCMMLASRQDYKRDSFKASDARFKIGGNPMANAKVHDGCRCSIMPIFAGQDTPDHTRLAESLWYDLSEGDGQEAYRSFRRNYEARIRAGVNVWQAA